MLTEKLTKRLALLLIAAMAVAVLGACGDGSNTTAPPTSTEGTQEDDVTTEITIGIATELDDVVDPHRMASAATREVLFNVYEGLVKPSADGDMIPAVASSYTVDENAFEFTLREGIKFHDGSPVNVEDVIYSISRASGLDGNEAIIPALSVIETIEATDDKTIMITLSEPNLELLAYLTVAIVPADYSGSAPPPGTGPYAYASRSPQENFVIERFDDYWGEMPHFSRVVYRIIENPETLVMAIKSGTIDFCAHLTYDQSTEVGDAHKIVPSAMKLIQAVYLNNAVVPLNDLKVRQALAHAIDRQEIMDIVADGYGFPLGSSVYPAFTKYFVPELVDMYEHDTEKAKSMLAEAGYEDGFDLVITVPASHTPHVDVATVVASQLAEVGVRATLNLIEWTTWLEEVYGGRNFEATVIGFDASALTARATLERFQSKKSGNLINFNNPEYDRVLAEAMAATDDEEQVRLYKRLQEMLAEECVSLYIQDLCDFVAIRNDIQGYTPYPLFVIDVAKLYAE